MTFHLNFLTHPSWVEICTPRMSYLTTKVKERFQPRAVKCFSIPRASSLWHPRLDIKLQQRRRVKFNPSIQSTFHNSMLAYRQMLGNRRLRPTRLPILLLRRPERARAAERQYKDAFLAVFSTKKKKKMPVGPQCLCSPILVQPNS